MIGFVWIDDRRVKRLSREDRGHHWRKMRKRWCPIIWIKGCLVPSSAKPHAGIIKRTVPVGILPVRVLAKMMREVDPLKQAMYLDHPSNLCPNIGANDGGRRPANESSALDHPLSCESMRQQPIQCPCPPPRRDSRFAANAEDGRFCSRLANGRGLPGALRIRAGRSATCSASRRCSNW